MFSDNCITRIYYKLYKVINQICNLPVSINQIQLFITIKITHLFEHEENISLVIETYTNIIRKPEFERFFFLFD